MKKLLFILLFSLTTCVLAYAQDNKPRTHAGDKSLNFIINGFGSFGVTGPVIGTTPLGGGADSLLRQLSQLVGQEFVRPVFGVGMTFFVSDNIGLRIGIGFNTVSNSTPRSNDTTGKTDKDSRTAFGISPALQIHLINAGPVTVYTGAALSFATASTSQGEDTLKTTQSQTGFGAGAILGAKFFPWSNISFGVESQLGVQINSTSSTARSKTTDGPSSTTLGFTLPVAVDLDIDF